MSVSLNKDPQSCSEKIQFQNSELNPSHNESARNHSLPIQKYPSMYRKTSKRRQIQEEKATILDLFKDLLTIVNLNFSKVSQNNGFKNKQFKIPKISKTASKIKKQQSIVHKQSQKKQEEKNSPKQEKKIIVQMIQEKCQIIREKEDRETAMNQVLEEYPIFMTYIINEQEQEEQNAMDEQIQNKFKTFQDQNDEENNSSSNDKICHLFQDEFQLFNHEDFDEQAASIDNDDQIQKKQTDKEKIQKQQKQLINHIQKQQEQVQMMVSESQKIKQ